MNDLRDLYEEMILEHNRNPRNYPKKPQGCNHSAHGFNPLCGDEFQVHATVRGGIIEDIGFEGAGCAISTASASMMTDAVKGKPVAEAEALFERVHQALTHEDNAATPDGDIGKLAVLTGVREYPMRVKCATLAWHVLHAALRGKADTVCTE
jgi:nitrogen fixation NifU-like protein